MIIVPKGRAPYKSQGFWCGVMFATIGLVGLVTSMDYPMGELRRIGAGFFPAMLSAFLLLSGIFQIGRAFFQSDFAVPRISLRPAFMIALSTVAFGLAISTFGLVQAIAVSVIIAFFAGRDGRWRELPLIIILMAVICFVIFVKIVKLPVQVI